MITFSFSGKEYQTDRTIGTTGGSDGPVLVFFGGLHGNERSGVIALQRVFDELKANQSEVRGQMIGLAGNLPALSVNRRFISKDLNRIWDRDFSKLYESKSSQANEKDDEDQQQHELFEIIEPFIKQGKECFFFDLHTTSAHSIPFMAINDQLNNRNFALQFPVPAVIGIEEYLEGPLLSYLNDFGHVALAFEAGQHDDPESVDTHVSFIYLAMLVAGAIDPEQIPNLKQHRLRLENQGRTNRGFFEVTFRKPVAPEDGFVMNPGYNNFMPINKGEQLASDRDGTIRASRQGRIFMPLYQSDGNDGFFIVRKVPLWTLKLSSVLRTINFERFLILLPGITRCQEHPDGLVVNRKVARFLTTEIFHLLGYRRKKADARVTIFLRREIE